MTISRLYEIIFREHPNFKDLPWEQGVKIVHETGNRFGVGGGRVFYCNQPNARFIYICMFLAVEIIRAANHYNARELAVASGLKFPYHARRGLIRIRTEDVSWIAPKLQNFDPPGSVYGSKIDEFIRFVLANKEAFEPLSLDDAYERYSRMTDVDGNGNTRTQPVNPAPTAPLEIIEVQGDPSAATDRARDSVQNLYVDISAMETMVTRLAEMQQRVDDGIEEAQARMDALSASRTNNINLFRSLPPDAPQIPRIMEAVNSVSVEFSGLVPHLNKLKELKEEIKRKFPTPADITSLEGSLRLSEAARNRAATELASTRNTLAVTRTELERSWRERSRLRSAASVPGNNEPLLQGRPLAYCERNDCVFVSIRDGRNALVSRSIIERSALPDLEQYLSSAPGNVADDDCCIICTERTGTLSCGNNSGGTPCAGTYCSKCYHKWFSENDKCPQCRRGPIPLPLRAGPVPVAQSPV
jgi:hypothetical protein